LCSATARDTIASVLVDVCVEGNDTRERRHVLRRQTAIRASARFIDFGNGQTLDQVDEFASVIVPPCA
jgi:hypothetical protein